MGISESLSVSESMHLVAFVGEYMALYTARIIMLGKT